MAAAMIANGQGGGHGTQNNGTTKGLAPQGRDRMGGREGVVGPDDSYDGSVQAIHDGDVQKMATGSDSSSTAKTVAIVFGVILLIILVGAVILFLIPVFRRNSGNGKVFVRPYVSQW